MKKKKVIMMILLIGIVLSVLTARCGADKTAGTGTNETVVKETETTEDDIAKEDSTEEESVEQEEEVHDDDPSLISPEFKQTMDDYEAWFDHYCDVMKRYQEDPSDVSILYEMTDLLSEESEMLEKMENMDQSEMNAAELAYYLEVTARIEKKLLEVAGY